MQADPPPEPPSGSRPRSKNPGRGRGREFSARSADRSDPIGENIRRALREVQEEPMSEELAALVRQIEDMEIGGGGNDDR